MCKKYPLVAMLLVGSASHSLVVSAVTHSTATMRFEGDISKTCSGRVVTSGVKEIFFGVAGALPEAKHEHQLEVSGNTLVKVELDLGATDHIYAYTSAPASTPTPIAVDLMSKKNTDTTFTKVNDFVGLKSGELINVYLHVPSHQESQLQPGPYKYHVTATIDCS
ncbi:TPA: hypothetical protein AB5B17_002988 [Vibrio mimicus]